MLSDINESDIVERLKQGNTEAFDFIFYKYSQSLIEFAKRELKADELVDDVVQDVFVKLWTSREKLNSEYSIRGFLFTCLKNRILNAVRTQKNIFLKHSRFVEVKEYYSAPADHEMILTDYKTVIHTFISKAPKSKRRVLDLSMQGYNNIEISEQVNLSTNTVKMYLSELKRGIKSLVLDPRSVVILLTAENVFDYFF